MSDLSGFIYSNCSEFFFLSPILDNYVGKLIYWNLFKCIGNSITSRYAAGVYNTNWALFYFSCYGYCRITNIFVLEFFLFLRFWILFYAFLRQRKAYNLNLFSVKFLQFKFSILQIANKNASAGAVLSYRKPNQ